MSESPAALLKRLPRYLYRGSLKRALVATGLSAHLKRAYFRLYFALSGGTETVEFGDESATFEVTSYEEYHVVNVAGGAERPVIEALREELEPGDVFYDVGANVGTYTCVVGKAIDGGQVVAFEPYGPNRQRIRRNAELNRVDVDVLPVALSSTAGRVQLHVLDSTAPGTQESSIDPAYADTDRSVSVVDVDAVTGDSLVEEGRIPPPNVVKIDVEGAGPSVIDGLEATLAYEDCRVLCVEPHGNHETLVERIRDLGFRVDHVTLAGERSTESPTILARKPT
ncbi:FkbM family methyltransferase [Salinirubellus salinus]|uniref:FkbM family methyltransferase n=1 Tax=Salinirubellus salinus TaxID=1364945 RepID=A0A9E7R2F5_9EURY|nr:FkbM family methyltransferase [Salinirubellus salinus]UWM54341.1 FkbM family methyltransferase [Salinirubellus salinus]